jgi:hypothetical protein
MLAQTAPGSKNTAGGNNTTSRPDTSLAEIVANAYKQHGPLRDFEDINVLETVILGALSASMPLADVLKCWSEFKTEFVDWNEVRISSAAEVAGTFPGAKHPIQLAMQLKEMLQVVFERRHMLSLEFLRENTIAETKEFFKRSPSLPDLARQLVLSYIKLQPHVPLESWAQGGLIRAGLLSSSVSAAQRQRQLFDQLDGIPLLHAVLALHEEARLHPDPAVEAAARKKAAQAKEAALKAAKAAKAAAKAARDKEAKEAREIAAKQKAAEKAASDKLARIKAAQKKAAQKKADQKKAEQKKAAQKKAAQKKAAQKKAAQKKTAQKKAAQKKAAQKKATKKSVGPKATKKKATKKKAAKKQATKKQATKKQATKKQATKKQATKKQAPKKKATKKRASKKKATKKSRKK